MALRSPWRCSRSWPVPCPNIRRRYFDAILGRRDNAVPMTCPRPICVVRTILPPSISPSSMPTCCPIMPRSVDGARHCLPGLATTRVTLECASKPRPSRSTLRCKSPRDVRSRAIQLGHRPTSKRSAARVYFVVRRWMSSSRIACWMPSSVSPVAGDPCGAATSSTRVPSIFRRGPTARLQPTRIPTAALVRPSSRACRQTRCRWPESSETPCSRPAIDA